MRSKIFSQFTAQHADLYLRLAKDYLDLETPGLFRTDAVSDENENDFIKFISELIKENKCDYGTLRAKCSTVNQLFKTNKIPIVEKNHLWATSAKKILQDSRFITKENGVIFKIWENFLNQIQKILSHHKKEIKANNFKAIEHDELLKPFWGMMNAFIENDFLDFASFLHRFISLVKESLIKQGVYKRKDESIGMLIGGNLGFALNLTEDDLKSYLPTELDKELLKIHNPDSPLLQSTSASVSTLASLKYFMGYFGRHLIISSKFDKDFPEKGYHDKKGKPYTLPQEIIPELKIPPIISLRAPNTERPKSTVLDLSSEVPERLAASVSTTDLSTRQKRRSGFLPRFSGSGIQKMASQIFSPRPLPQASQSTTETNVGDPRPKSKTT